MAAIPFIARLMEVLDSERVMVASAVGVRVVTTRGWLKIAYNADGENLHEAIHNQSGYRGISAPATLSHRYGVSVRGMESIIRLACIIHRTDYWRWGRTLERLGVEHLRVSELTRYVTVKIKHQMPIHARRPKLTPISVTRVEQARKNRWTQAT
ncbi:MAG: NAD/NADP octopine/nopaline dehydrogenase family protein [Anaerolineales bacterium]|nr:NAD/NADP octopine/nopaline dehydrogenase family protein [Anaerolineales bacterium]